MLPPRSLPPVHCCSCGISFLPRCWTSRAQNSERKDNQKAYNFVQRNTAVTQMPTQWHINCLTDITSLPGCVLLPINILETRGNGKEIKVQNFIWKNCRACYKPIQVVSDTMLTLYIVVYSTGVLRDPHQNWGPKERQKILTSPKRAYNKNWVFSPKQEKGRQWQDFLV